MINAFRDFIDSVCGVYSPVTYTLESGDIIIPAGFAGVDWSYVVAGAVFCIVIYSVFKLLGGVICKMF